MVYNSEHFTNRTNVEFVEVISSNEVVQRTWERGSGETLACGTGASAVGVAGSLRGLTGNDTLIHLKGGDIRVQWNKDENVYMTGEAAYICDGELHPNVLKDLKL